MMCKQEFDILIEIESLNYWPEFVSGQFTL